MNLQRRLGKVLGLALIPGFAVTVFVATQTVAKANSYSNAYYNSFPSGTREIWIDSVTSNGAATFVGSGGPYSSYVDIFYEINGFDSSGNYLATSQVDESYQGGSFYRKYLATLWTYDSSRGANSYTIVPLASPGAGNNTGIRHYVRLYPDSSYPTGYKIDAHIFDSSDHPSGYYSLGTGVGTYFGRANGGDNYQQCNYNSGYTHKYTNAYYGNGSSFIPWPGSSLSYNAQSGCTPHSVSVSGSGSLANGGTSYHSVY